MTKRIVAAAATVALLLLNGAAARNQSPRKVTGFVAHAPSGLASTGQPIRDARVEYRDDSANEAQVTSTDGKGYFEFPAGRSGIVTASKAGLAAISVGWPPRSRLSDLRIELPQPAVLEGALYDMATRQTVPEGLVTVTVDHPVSPLSDSVFTETGRFTFKGLPPGPAVVVTHAPGFAPTYSVVNLEAGRVRDARIGLLLEGTVSGRVLDGSENAAGAEVFPVYGSSFEAAEMIASFVGGRLVTGDDGLFRINGIVPDQTFSLYAETADGRRSDVVTLRATPGIPIENVVLRVSR